MKLTDKLSPKEKHVLCILATGMSRDQMADHFGWKDQSYLSRILQIVYLKLGCQDRLAATRIALREGLININFWLNMKP